MDKQIGEVCVIPFPLVGFLSPFSALPAASFEVSRQWKSSRADSQGVQSFRHPVGQGLFPPSHLFVQCCRLCGQAAVSRDKATTISLCSL